MASWIGWRDDDYDARPWTCGVSFLGQMGPNEAEYGAFLLGLGAAVERLQTTRSTFDEIVVHTDNEWVAMQLNGEKGIDRLKTWHHRASELIAFLAATQAVGVEVRQIPRKENRAHALCTERGWNALFTEKRWHPQKGFRAAGGKRKRTVKVPAWTADDDIPF